MKNYTAPTGKSKEFKRFWKKFIPKVVERDNFHESHLEQLTILCDIYVEYNTLSTFLRENGYTYDSDGRYGFVTKERPETKIQQKFISEIRQYSKILGLILAKDTAVKEDQDKDEWG